MICHFSSLFFIKTKDEKLSVSTWRDTFPYWLHYTSLNQHCELLFFYENRHASLVPTLLKTINHFPHFPSLPGLNNTKTCNNKNRRKAIFNWAAKGLLFLRGGGGYTHSGYNKTLSATIACNRISCETET